jgi:hypothetical protein
MSERSLSRSPALEGRGSAQADRMPEFGKVDADGRKVGHSLSKGLGEIRLFTQRLVRAYVSFDKGSEQIHSVLYGFGHRDWRKVATPFQLHIRFTNITPKILPIQIFDLAPVDDIQIRILPIKLDREYRNLLQIDS